MASPTTPGHPSSSAQSITPVLPPNSPNEPISPTTTQSSSTSVIPLPSLKRELQQVARARKEAYHIKTAVLFYWEGDDTGASEDIARLKYTFENILGFEVICLEISQRDPFPSFEIGGKIEEIARAHQVKNRQSIIAVAYVGHATSTGYGDMIFQCGSSRKIYWSNLKGRLSPGIGSGLEKIDVFYLLDCCYSGVATRAQSLQTVQVLAACGPNETARARTHGGNYSGATFTQRFCGEIERAQKYHKTSISVASIFAELLQHSADSSPRPCVGFISGSTTITFAIEANYDTPSLIPRPVTAPGEQHHVLVKLTLAGSEKQVLPEFQDTIQGLPQSMRVQVVNAWKTTHSALVLVRMTWETWFMISVVRELEIVGTIIGPSLLHAPKQLLTENIPPYPKKET